MPTRIYLTRHGETVWNREGRTQGWTDIELNANGRRHAAALAGALKDLPLGAVYASTLCRARATAEAIAACHGLTVVTEPDLRELNQGTLDGLTFEELRRDHAALLKDWATSPATLRMPGGESMAELQERAWGAIERIAATHPDGTVVAVSHNLTIITIICRLLGVGLDSFRRLRQDVAAVNVLELGGPRGAVALRVNDTAHLSSGVRFVADLARLRDTFSFSSAPVNADDLQKIMGAARCAGLPEERCRVVVVPKGAERDGLCVVARPATDRATVEYTDEGLVRSAMRSAPLVLAIFSRSEQMGSEARMGAAIQNMRLAAHALGYGTAWLAEGLCDERLGIAEALGIGPEWRLIALVPIGVPG